MRAIVIARPGGPEVLELRDVPLPEPGAGEVRVRVRACGLNRADMLQRMGAYPAPPDVPADIPGLEFAGEIDAVGRGVVDFREGDRVFGLSGGGAYAEAVRVHARTLARIPDGMAFDVAAAIPEAFITAYDAVVVQGGLDAGDTLLVHAVGSGVGTAAVQIAKAVGADVIGTARSQAKLERARELGLTHGIVPEVQGASVRFADAVRANTRGRGADVVLELVGGGYVSESLASMAERGRLLLVGLLSGTRAEVDLAQLLRRRHHVIGTQLRARPLEEKIAAGQHLDRRLGPLFAKGVLRPIVDRVLPLEKAEEAHVAMTENANFGKIVLTT